MKIDRVLIVLSIVISVAASTISVVALRRDPFGAGVASYDLSSPENTLRSINRMVAAQNLRAAWELVKANLQSDSGSPEAKLYFADDARIQVLKSIEVANSADPKNNGLIVSFVKLNVAGVDYNIVQYFRKDQANRFMIGGNFYIPYGMKKTDQDIALEPRSKPSSKRARFNPNDTNSAAGAGSSCLQATRLRQGWRRGPLLY